MPARPARAKVKDERLHRKYPRFRTGFPVGLCLLTDGQYRNLQGHCKDLSGAGIGVLISTELKIGEVASLSFCLPGTQQSCEIRAVLRHRHGHHYGFEFLSLSSLQDRLIQQHLKGLDRVD